MTDGMQPCDSRDSVLWHRLAARFAILSEDDLESWNEPIDWRALSAQSECPMGPGAHLYCDQARGN
jgi:hypothetical protein